MKILVTGGAGFIGSNFIHYILKKYPDYKIINLDFLTYAGNLENLKEAENNPNYRFIKGDICDALLVNDLVKYIDLIVHFAAESHVDRSILDSTDFIRTNVEGTRILLEAAKNIGGVRFHHVSTDEVYGSLGPNEPSFHEKTPYDPHSPYSASKAASDHLVSAYYHTFGLPITISNCSNNYGPYQFPEKFIPLAITNLMEGKKVPIYGDGMNVRDWLYIEDHCEAIDLIIHKGKIGETYCIGGGSELPNIELVKKIIVILNESEKPQNNPSGLDLKLTLFKEDSKIHETSLDNIKSLRFEEGENGEINIVVSKSAPPVNYKSKIEFVKDRPGHDRRYSMNFSKIMRELGWSPRTSFDEGIKKTIEWYKNNESWWRNIKSGEYREYYKKQYGIK